MNEINTTTEFNINKVKVVKELQELGYKVTKTCELFETLNLKEELKNEFVALDGLLIGSNDDIDNEEKIFSNVIDIGQGVKIGFERQFKDFYYVELEKENKIAYVIVQVKKGAFVNGNKVIVKNNEHRFLQLGFDTKEYHYDWNEFRNEFTPNEFKEWKEFTKSWREIIS
jgi:hypothetical protein